jgi:ABC-type transport system involved in multi-copper enzyme maturation permease subunit
MVRVAHPGQAAVVLTAYLVVLLGLAALVFQRRDVTGSR